MSCQQALLSSCAWLSLHGRVPRGQQHVKGLASKPLALFLRGNLLGKGKRSRSYGSHTPSGQFLPLGSQGPVLQNIAAGIKAAVAVAGTEAESCMRQGQDGQQVETSVPVSQLPSNLLLPRHWSSPGSQRLGGLWDEHSRKRNLSHGLRSLVSLVVETKAGRERR